MPQLQTDAPRSPGTKILISFYSRTGTIEALARAKGEGAAAEVVQVRLRRAREFVPPETMALAPGWKEQAEAMNARYEAPTPDESTPMSLPASSSAS